MKRLLLILLILSMTAAILGCSFNDSDILEPVEFYYRLVIDETQVADTVIGSETREAAGHSGDLNYLLSLYLQGPLDETLIAPFPRGCKLQRITWEPDTLCVTLDSSITSLKNMDRTLACACIAKTCFSLTEIAQVRIVAAGTEDTESIDITIGVDDLVLRDNAAPTENPQ